MNRHARFDDALWFNDTNNQISKQSFLYFSLKRKIVKGNLLLAKMIGMNPFLCSSLISKKVNGTTFIGNTFLTTEEWSRKCYQLQLILIVIPWMIQIHKLEAVLVGEN